MWWLGCSASDFHAPIQITHQTLNLQQTLCNLISETNCVIDELVQSTTQPGNDLTGRICGKKVGLIEISMTTNY